ncbi:hypothetical protein BTHE68_49620 [Burkholderia sp. THE68]|uniref:hypothetical protein n=1 Tax=Burkholderiaceae TaxID=119060 RepID=UPI0013183DCC|nr:MULTISPECIES: hypothetical protein [Burkholderiaceae]BBU31228.1 hypothetical protein BTHE68_49620 [Burkholderia sp. THE68]BCQ26346.1 hypothetical protein NK8_45300 [Caballeronia sp. NK8]
MNRNTLSLAVASFALICIGALACPKTGDMRPKDEAALIAVVNHQAQRWDDAENDVQHESIGPARDTSLCNMPKEARNWSGTVERIDTYLANEARFEIRIAPNLTLGTNGELQDAGSKIQRGTRLFDSVAKLSRGQRVVFSGRFVPDSKGCLTGYGTAERGSAIAPKFVFAFDRVSLLR